MPPSPRAPAGQSLSQRAYARIKDDIITCKLAPGVEVSESLLSQRCGLGKAPVRAALARLSQEGLVRAAPRRGYEIAAITLRDINDLFDLRMALESLAARLASGRIAEERLVALDKAWSEGYPGEAADASYLRANKAFHTAIADASGNARLAAILSQIHDQADRLIYLGLPLADERDEIRQGHKPLIDALVKGDAEAAGRIAAAHVLAAKAIRIDTVMANSTLLETSIRVDTRDDPRRRPRAESRPITPPPSGG